MTSLRIPSVLFSRPLTRSTCSSSFLVPRKVAWCVEDLGLNPWVAVLHSGEGGGECSRNTHRSEREPRAWPGLSQRTDGQTDRRCALYLHPEAHRRLTGHRVPGIARKLQVKDTMIHLPLLRGADQRLWAELLCHLVASWEFSLPVVPLREPTPPPPAPPSPLSLV